MSKAKNVCPTCLEKLSFLNILEGKCPICQIQHLPYMLPYREAKYEVKKVDGKKTFVPKDDFSERYLKHRKMI